MVSVLAGPKYTSQVLCRNRGTNRGGGTLIRQSINRHDAVVTEQVTRIPCESENRAVDQSELATSTVIALRHSMASYQKLENIHRPSVLAEIPQNTATLQTSTGRRPKNLR